MAVEAHHLHFFPPQLLSNREIINTIETNSNLYNTQMGFGITGTESLIPFYNYAIADPIPATVAMTTNPSDSGLTCNLSTPRKRLREFSNSTLPISNSEKDQNPVHPFSFLGQDISFQIQQQQFEIDRFISQHQEKVRRDLTEKRRRHARQLVAVVEEGMIKRLKAKEEEIEKIGKLNWALEEKVKSLCMENQIWRDLAQNSEATANALRSNIEQVLAQVRSDRSRCEIADDAESCCGSSGEEQEEGERRRLAEAGEERNVVNDKRSCRNCEGEDSCVLLLPCRHLCVCAACGSTIQTCPICKCNKNGSVHVNMS